MQVSLRYRLPELKFLRNLHDEPDGPVAPPYKGKLDTSNTPGG